jgi:hypothetical protein
MIFSCQDRRRAWEPASSLDPPDAGCVSHRCTLIAIHLTITPWRTVLHVQLTDLLKRPDASISRTIELVDTVLNHVHACEFFVFSIAPPRAFAAFESALVLVIGHAVVDHAALLTSVCLGQVGCQTQMATITITLTASGHITPREDTPQASKMSCNDGKARPR